MCRSRRARVCRVVAVNVATVALALAGPGCEDARRPAAPACVVEARDPGTLVIAGSGSGLALLRSFARRYQDAHPEARIEVPESIGTSGGLRALHDGAIDIALVSRPLTAAEHAGVTVTPLARVLAAFATRARVTDLDAAALAEIYAGKRARWPDGTRVVPFVRQAGDSANALIATHLPEVGRAIEAALASERLPVAYTDQELEAALLNVDGAIGLIDLAALRLDGPALYALALGGVLPEREAALAGRYPLVTPLALVTRGDAVSRSAEARGFLDFVISAAADDLFVGPVLRPVPVDVHGR